MELKKKDEIITPDILEDYGPDVSIVTVKSNAFAAYLAEKADILDEIDEDDVEFSISIDNANEVNIVFNRETDLCDEFEFFFRYLEDAFSEDCGLDFCDYEDELSDFEDMVKPEDIESIEWYKRVMYNQDSFDCVLDMYFDEAKKQYAIENDIEDDAIDDIDDNDVNEFISGSFVAYAFQKYVYNKATGEDGILEKYIELL